MKFKLAYGRGTITTDEDVVHAPFTLYLNSQYQNPHTMAVAARALRVLVRLVDAFDIDVASRALEGRCLSETEMQAIRQLVFHPISTIEAMSNRTVQSIAKAHREGRSVAVQGGVDGNTAKKQLVQIADFLLWYLDRVLEPRMPLSGALTEALRRSYTSCATDLKDAIASHKTSHPHKIRSVPAKRFLEIYAALYLKPRDVLQTQQGRVTANILRDRAMLLVAAEGVRPGALGNIARADFKWAGGSSRGYLSLKDNSVRRSKPVTTSTPTQKGSRSKQNYNSEITISLWPTTAQAVQNYIDDERPVVTSKGLRNKTEGFLFAAGHGGPIGDRSTISAVFRGAGRGLRRLGLLARDREDPYLDGEEYSFSSYLLRHSSVSLFYSEKSKAMQGEAVEDLMKMRFGWAQESGMPRLYAQRALSDAASLTVDDFIESLLAEAQASKSNPGTDGHAAG